jgi:hypothetical protein
MVSRLLYFQIVIRINFETNNKNTNLRHDRCMTYLLPSKYNNLYIFSIKYILIITVRDIQPSED